VKKENLAYLIAGFVFGTLTGLGLYNAFFTGPQLSGAPAPTSAVPAPAGPMAPTQSGPAGASANAPMVAEINRLKRLLQEQPENVDAAVRLANMYQDVEMWDTAILFYEKALKIRPDDPDLLTDAGVCYRGVGKFDRALELFGRAQAANPRHWQSLFNTAVVAGFDLGEFERAFRALDSVERMAPARVDVEGLRQALMRARDASSGAGGS
jgi:tetratricopeptide (TPR) repeat protein